MLSYHNPEKPMCCTLFYTRCTLGSTLAEGGELIFLGEGGESLHCLPGGKAVSESLSHCLGGVSLSSSLILHKGAGAPTPGRPGLVDLGFDPGRPG